MSDIIYLKSLDSDSLRDPSVSACVFRAGFQGNHKPGVYVGMTFGGGSVAVTLTPAQAEEFAASLKEAARLARWQDYHQNNRVSGQLKDSDERGQP
ncbi:MAG: hypothetical protein PF501_14750 [Salinisphaera sp.]|jgi:hypothetical protein|nr:hypothetical protein [Salinisphaera sp.]